jgi:hypothetical protein
MINSDRIVPVMKTDLLSLYGTVLNLIGTSHEVLESPDVEGNFVVETTGDAGNILCNQPAKTIDFADGTTAAVVYFIAAYDFAGFTIAGVVEEADGEVKADGATLYKAVLSSGDITVTAL